MIIFAFRRKYKYNVSAKSLKFSIFSLLRILSTDLRTETAFELDLILFHRVWLYLIKLKFDFTPSDPCPYNNFQIVQSESTTELAH